MGVRADESLRVERFDAFVRDEGLRLRRALIARYGVESGTEAAADALRYAWEHWDRLATMANPIGYLYRVGQSASRRERRWRREVAFPSRDASYVDSSVDGELFDVLARLTAAQRESVLLVHAYGWTYEQVAEVLGIRVTAVRNHVHRGTAKLRRLLDDDAR
jgi:RNA polymerase sigma factor (sigma-70 family)